MARVTFYILTFLIGWNCFSQNDKIQEKDTVPNNGYIKKFNSLIGVKLSFIDVSNSFDYFNKRNKTTYDIIPNLKQRIAIGFQYRFIEFGFGFSPTFLPGNNSKNNDNADIYNLNFRGIYKRLIQTLSFYHQTGFTISSNGSKYNAPYFETNKIQGSTALSLNSNFSYRATIGQREWQTKSAGSFIPKITYDYTNFVMESSGFDSNAQSANIGFIPSYQYSYVINNHMFISAGGAVGIGLNYNNFGGNSIFTTLFSVSANAVFGFNLNRYFGGIHADFSKLKYNGHNHIQLDDNITYIDVYIGYRFKAPKLLTKTADKINDTFNIED